MDSFTSDPIIDNTLTTLILLSLMFDFQTIFTKLTSSFYFKSSSKSSPERAHCEKEILVGPDEKLLKRLKDRVNYASSACSARILASNPEAAAPSALLSPSKDTYLRYACALKDKFVVVELCEAVKIDTVVLANYELFASTVSGFKVYGAAEKLTDPGVTQVLWKLILTAEMSDRLASQDQAFPVESGAFIKYLRIEFNDQFHGHERLCPISVLKVYGKTMLDEFKEDLNLSGDGKSKAKDVVSITNVSKTNLLKEMSQIADKITELQLISTFCMRTWSLIPECPESEQLIQDLKQKYAELEMRSVASESHGNVFKQFHDRLNKLEISLKEHPINLILFRSRRHSHSVQDDDRFPKLTGTAAATPEIDDLFSAFRNDISSLKKDFQHLNATVALQQNKITLLIVVNSLMILLILIRAVRKVFSRSVSDEHSLKRRPLLELKSSPSTKSSSLSNFNSKSNSNLSNSRGSIAHSSTPGVVLSDDEVLHLLDEQ